MHAPVSPAPRRGIRIGLAALLFVANLMLQFGMSARGLDDAPVNALHPTASDALEYVRAAEAVADDERGFAQGFTDAFGSAWRTPGYSLFLAGFERAFDAPLRAARVAQILLTAAIAPIVLWTLTALIPFPAALAGAAAAAVWPPLYHYSAAILAEPLSLLAMALLLLTLSRGFGGGDSRAPARGHASRRELAAAATTGLLLAALIYLKPNHVLLIVPVCGFLLTARGWRNWTGWRATAVAVGAAAILIAPWSLFASRQQGSFVALSTTSGYNLYLGTGVPPVDVEDGSLPSRAALELGLRGGPVDLPREPEIAADPRARGTWKSAAWSAELGRKARAIWGARPGAEILHGAAKASHAFGFSMRSARDILLMAFFTVAALCAVALRKRPGMRPWAVFFGLCALTVALQAFVWLPNQRLKTVLFDLPALLMPALYIGARRAGTPAK